MYFRWFDSHQLARLREIMAIQDVYVRMRAISELVPGAADTLKHSDTRWPAMVGIYGAWINSLISDLTAADAEILRLREIMARVEEVADAHV